MVYKYYVIIICMMKQFKEIPENAMIIATVVMMGVTRRFIMIVMMMRHNAMPKGKSEGCIEK